MAVINLTLGKAVESCPKLTIADKTNYVSEGFFPSAIFRFHDYSSGNPTINTTYTFSNLEFDTTNFTTVTLSIEVDGSGNIVNAESQYLAFVKLINDESSSINAELIKPDGTGFKDWYVRIFAYDGSVSGGLTDIDATSGITPVTSNISIGSLIKARNISLYGPDGTALDLGSVKQVDNLTLSSSTYEVGKIFTVSFCGEDITYTVESDNTAECVAKGIASAVNAVVDTSSLFYKYVAATSAKGVVTFTSKEAGVPLDISFTYTGTEDAALTTATANISSMSVPSETASNEFGYKTIERGGKYTSVLTVVSGCDYNTTEDDFFSWCYDIDGFQCCFISLLSKKECCKNSKSVYDDASNIQNIIKAISVMKENNYTEAEIQSVVNLGHSICEPLKCKCGC